MIDKMVYIVTFKLCLFPESTKKRKKKLKENGFLMFGFAIKNTIYIYIYI